MAGPWWDTPAAWGEGAAGFAPDDALVAVTVCRLGLAAVAPAVAVSTACPAARLLATAGETTGRGRVAAVAQRLWGAILARVAAGQGRVLGAGGGVRLAGRLAPAAALVRGRAWPTRCRLAVRVPDSLAGTGIREVARLVSPLCTGCRLVSPLAPAVFVQSFVETEQT